jgi:hypothetical protein
VRDVISAREKGKRVADQMDKAFAEHCKCHSKSDTQFNKFKGTATLFALDVVSRAGQKIVSIYANSKREQLTW